METGSNYFFFIIDFIILSTITFYQMNQFLNSPITALKKTSVITIKRFKAIGIQTLWQLLNYLPIRYLDYSLISSIDRLQTGETVTVIGKIKEITNHYTRRGLIIQKAIITQGNSQLTVIWYNQPYLLRILNHHQSIAVAGAIERFGRQLVLICQEYQQIPSTIQPKLIHVGRLIPVYSEKNQLTSRLIREKINFVLENLGHLSDFLPDEIIKFNLLIDLLSAYKNIHFPQNRTLLAQARRRLAFNELFILMLTTSMIKRQWNQYQLKHSLINDKQTQLKISQFINQLPFKLTSAQQRSLNEIINDLAGDQPMNRFLQGDVGSGKTVVAAIASYFVILNRVRVIFMAPTEILALQHYYTVKQLFRQIPINIGLLTAGHQLWSDHRHEFKPNGKNINKIISQTDILIGTHALLNKKLSFTNIGLVIIDEQHRFGVKQRALLKDKAAFPHLLTMTATPIPRTLALTIFGDLDISYIDEIPTGRPKVKTFIIPASKRDQCYQWIKNQIKINRVQAFIICQLIDQSENQLLPSIKAAKKEYQYLKTKVFPQLKLGLLHGQLKSKEKQQIMQNYKDNKIQILVSTSVVEVGIDISNATIMIIEGAERYGLAQLHQLRGRIGRGDKQSYCFLFTDKDDPKVNQRLNYFCQTDNGIKLAEYDLKHRGPGEIYGFKQHGFTDLKIANLTDLKLINQTKKAVAYFNQHYRIEQFPAIKQQLDSLPHQLITNN